MGNKPLKLMQLILPTKSIEELYRELPYSPETGQFSCARSFQLLFNEVVTIKEELDEEVLCEVCNAFYEDSETKEIIKQFWMLKKNIVRLETVKTIFNDLSAVPQPYAENKSVLKSDEILTLISPYLDVETGKIYSAGTRFVRSKQFDSDKNYCAIFCDFENKQVRKLFIDRDCAFTSADLTDSESIANFVNLLKKWANQDSKKIPFLWGGCSFTQVVDPSNYQLVNAVKAGQETSYWERQDLSTPHSGFDAALIILRAAQICSMPYFFKTTFTAMQNLEPIASADSLNNGDLIWYPGALAVISDLTNNTLIASFGYKNWNGIVQTVKLSQVFENIINYDDLLEAYYKQTPLRVLNALGEFTREIPSFKILKINSVFRK